MEQNLSFCTLNGVWGDDFRIKFKILEKKSFHFFLLDLVFLNVITAP